MATNHFQIDVGALDKDWANQSALYHDYAMKLADAKLALLHAQNNLKKIEAELAVAVREDPAKFVEGATKPTDELVKVAVQRHPDVVNARDAIAIATYDVEVLKAACLSLDHKKKALENLVSLHGQDYFSAPRTPTGAAAVNLNHEPGYIPPQRPRRAAGVKNGGPKRRKRRSKIE